MAAGVTLKLAVLLPVACKTKGGNACLGISAQHTRMKCAVAANERALISIERRSGACDDEQNVGGLCYFIDNRYMDSCELTRQTVVGAELLKLFLRVVCLHLFVCDDLAYEEAHSVCG